VELFLPGSLTVNFVSSPLFEQLEEKQRKEGQGARADVGK